MQNAPLILAIETSTGFCSVALWQGDAALAVASEKMPGQQSRLLVPMVEDVLARAKCTYVDCDAVACTLGPGGFTSLRVWLASARSMALAANKPFIGLGTMEVMAAASGIRGDIVTSIDAHRDQWYAQRFRMRDALEALGEPLLVDESGLKALSHGAKPAQTLPHAIDVARLAHARWMSGQRDFPSAPVYIREPDAKLPTSADLT